MACDPEGEGIHAWFTTSFFQEHQSVQAIQKTGINVLERGGEPGAVWSSGHDANGNDCPTDESQDRQERKEGKRQILIGYPTEQDNSPKKEHR